MKKEDFKIKQIDDRFYIMQKYEIEEGLFFKKINTFWKTHSFHYNSLKQANNVIYNLFNREEIEECIHDYTGEKL